MSYCSSEKKRNCPELTGKSVQTSKALHWGMEKMLRQELSLSLDFSKKCEEPTATTNERCRNPINFFFHVFGHCVCKNLEMLCGIDACMWTIEHVFACRASCSCCLSISFKWTSVKWFFACAILASTVNSATRTIRFGHAAQFGVNVVCSDSLCRKYLHSNVEVDRLACGIPLHSVYHWFDIVHTRHHRVYIYSSAFATLLQIPEWKLMGNWQQLWANAVIHRNLSGER